MAPTGTLYAWLTPGQWLSRSIGWNFEKFLIDRWTGDCRYPQEPSRTDPLFADLATSVVRLTAFSFLPLTRVAFLSTLYHHPTI